LHNFASKSLQVDKNLAGVTRKKLKRLKKINILIEFIHAYPNSYIVLHPICARDLIPFSHKPLEAVIKNIKELLVAKPRKIYFGYYDL